MKSVSYVRLTQIYFVIIFISISASLYAQDLSGIWIGTLSIDFIGQETEVEFIDLFYQEGDTLFMFDSSLCEDEPTSFILEKNNLNTYSLKNSFSCNIFGLELIFNNITFSFSDNSLSGSGSGSAEGYNYTFRMRGHKQPINILEVNESKMISGAEDSIVVYSIDVPPNAVSLTVSTGGGWGDCDLDLFYGKPPFYHDFSDDESTSELITFNHPASGIWYLVVWGFEDYEGVSLRVDIEEGASTKPVVKLNTNNGSTRVSLGSESLIRLNLSLLAGSYEGTDADWWLIMVTPLGEIEYFDLNVGSFIQGFAPTYRGPLMDIPHFDLPIYADFQLGKYTFYFGIDLIGDNSLTFDNLFYDFIDVTFTP